MTKKVFLVTGASSGIGLDTVKTLAQQGHQVYAGVRTQASQNRLRLLTNVVPLILDVSCQEHIDKAVEVIATQSGRLDGLVNNAGLGGLGGVLDWTMTELQQLFAVNVFAPINLVKKCFDLLLHSGGRVVNIGSQGGLITSPFFGPYTMSKAALDTYSDVLEQELRHTGIYVSLVQPGNIATNMESNSKVISIERLQRAKPAFAQLVEPMLQNLLKEQIVDAKIRKPSKVDIVTEVILQALFDETPKKRYVVGTRFEAERLLNELMQRIAQVNESQALGYSDEQLIELLRQ